MIDAKTIAAVHALTKFGNFRAAADALGTSPASFSRYIQQAEAYAGHILFERTRQGATLTSAGQQFLTLLEALHSATSLFEAGVGRLRAAGPERLNIGCGPLTSRIVITPLLAELLEDMPDLRARIDVRATKEPLESLRMGLIDLAVCDLTHTPDLSDLDIQMLRKEPVFFCARPGHPLHGKSTVSAADIFRQPFMTAHLHQHWRQAIANILGADQDAWQIVERLPQVECDDFSLVADLASKSHLICAGMREDFSQHLELGLLQQIPTIDELTWNICAARRKSVNFEALDLFWTRLRDQFGAG